MEEFPFQEPVSPSYRSWSLKRGRRKYAGWLDCVVDKRGPCTSMKIRWGREKNTKRRTLRTFRDGSARKWSR